MKYLDEKFERPDNLENKEDSVSSLEQKFVAIDDYDAMNFLRQLKKENYSNLFGGNTPNKI